MLDTLRNTLLIMLLVILVYVLYKRMLIVLGKNEIKERFIYFTEDSLHTENPKIVRIEVKVKAEVKVNVFATNGNIEAVIFDGELEPGIHPFDLSDLKLPEGRYYCKLQTAKQEDSLYFNA